MQLQTIRITAVRQRFAVELIRRTGTYRGHAVCADNSYPAPEPLRRRVGPPAAGGVATMGVTAATRALPVHKQTRNHRRGDNGKMAAGYAYPVQPTADGKK